MITEKGTLVVGLPVPNEAGLHKEFEIQPMFVKGSIEAEAYAKDKSEHHAVIYGIASQIVKVGALCQWDWKDTAQFADYLIDNIAEVDLIILADARHRLEKKLDDLIQRPENTTEPETTD
jgi:hypothetical protein